MVREWWKKGVVEQSFPQKMGLTPINSNMREVPWEPLWSKGGTGLSLAACPGEVGCPSMAIYPYPAASPAEVIKSKACLCHKTLLVPSQYLYLM